MSQNNSAHIWRESAIRFSGMLNAPCLRTWRKIMSRVYWAIRWMTKATAAVWTNSLTNEGWRQVNLVTWIRFFNLNSTLLEVLLQTFLKIDKKICWIAVKFKITNVVQTLFCYLNNKNRENLFFLCAKGFSFVFRMSNNDVFGNVLP